MGFKIFPQRLTWRCGTCRKVYREGFAVFVEMDGGTLLVPDLKEKQFTCCGRKQDLPAIFSVYGQAAAHTTTVARKHEASGRTFETIPLIPYSM